MYILAFVSVALLRMDYPFELEGIEGATLESVKRLLSGNKLYLRPSIEWVALPYTPGYFYFSAALAKVTGLSFVPLRFISFVSALGCLWFIFLFVKRETGNMIPGLIAAGLFAATYRLTESWFDVARVDSLFLVFLIAGSYIIKFHASRWGLVIAAILIFLSYWTKQTGLAIAVPILAYSVYVHRRKSIPLVSTVAILLILDTLTSYITHDGWNIFYTIESVRQHPLYPLVFGYAFTRELLFPLGVACVMSLIYVHIAYERKSRHDALFYVLLMIGMVTASVFSRSKWGSSENALMPAYAVVAVLFGLAIGTIESLCRKQPEEVQRRCLSYTYVACAVQLCALVYNPVTLLPTNEDLEAGRDLVARIGRINGEVFIPYHPYLAGLAGKQTYVAEDRIQDLLTFQSAEIGEQLRKEIEAALCVNKFTVVILDDYAEWMKNPKGYMKELLRHYNKKDTVFKRKDVFATVIGGNRPETIYVPDPRRDDSECENNR